MAGFLYFLPGLQTLPDGKVDELGLRYAFDRAPTWAEPNSTDTPSGTAGIFMADSERLGGMSLGYFPAEQRWQKKPGVEVYVGLYTAARPTPAELLRTKGLAGEFVELADGNRWQIPRLRMWAEADGFNTALPRMIDMDESGKLVPGETVDRWEHLDAINARLWEALTESPLGKAPVLDTEEAVRISAELIGVNYAVGLFELTKLLKVFSEERSVVDACHAAQSWRTFSAWYEKKNAVSSQPASTG